MATTLRVDSFNDINIAERSELTDDALVGATGLKLRNTTGSVSAQTIYVGRLSREDAGSAMIASVDDETSAILTAPLNLPHERYDAVTAVVGATIRIYRAPNVDGAVPADEALETPLSALDAVRGQYVPHYACLRDIRQAAGLMNAYSLDDGIVEIWRDAAQSEINTASGWRP